MLIVVYLGVLDQHRDDGSELANDGGRCGQLLGQRIVVRLLVDQFQTVRENAET